MNNADNEYFRLLNLVLEKGRRKKNRTGIDTLGVFGAQARFDLSEGFPLLTTKKVFWRGIVHELLWFLSGSSNIKYLVDNGVHIWDANAYDRYTKNAKGYENCVSLNQGTSPSSDFRRMTLDEYVERIKTDKLFADKWGELGEGTYGSMWRTFPYAGDLVAWAEHTNHHEIRFVDQIRKVIDSLKNDPDSRRHIVSAWHPYWVDHCALPPCHVLIQFHTEELTENERIKLYYSKYATTYLGDGMFKPEVLDEHGVPRRRLNCMMTQRSLDLPVGGPYNLASYSLLTHMVAQCVNMLAGEFIWSIGDCHIYLDQMEGIKEQLSREPRALSKLVLNPEIKNVLAFQYEDIKLEGYVPHPVIKLPMAV